ncbi:MAG: flagellar hook-length control protein FliK, partial [Rickettsiales bacterium]
GGENHVGLTQQSPRQDAKAAMAASLTKNGTMPQPANGNMQPANAVGLGAELQANTALASADQPAGMRFGQVLEQQGDTGLRHTFSPGNTPADQVAVKVKQAISGGATKVDIHLKPAELGRVHVQINTDADGQSHVTVTADRKDSLDLLQRDARMLERALQDAGLKTDSNNLSFNLRGDDQGQQQAKQNGQREGAEKFDLNGEGDEEINMDETLPESDMALTYSANRAYSLSLEWGLDISV